MAHGFDDDKGKVDIDALVAALKSACWGWLD